MALAVDTEMPTQTGGSGSGTSLTFSFNNAAGTHMRVGATACATSAITVSGVTYAAAAVTKLDNQNYATATDVWLGAKATPATGANNIVITASTSANSITGGAITFTGEHATTPNGTAFKATGSGTTPSVAVTGTATGNIVVAQSASGSAFSATGSLQTLSWRANVNNNDSGNNGQMSREPGNGGTVTMTETCGSDSWGIVACEVIAAAAGGATRPVKMAGAFGGFSGPSGGFAA